MIEKYIEFKANPSNNEKDDAFFCSAEGVSLDTLAGLKQENTEWMMQVLQKRRAQYILRLLEVDEGLFLKAKAGDVKAIELVYERWENYIRKKPDVGIAVNVNLAGMILNAHRPKGTIELETNQGDARALSQGPALLQ